MAIKEAAVSDEIREFAADFIDGQLSGFERRIREGIPREQIIATCGQLESLARIASAAELGLEIYTRIRRCNRSLLVSLQRQ